MRFSHHSIPCSSLPGYSATISKATNADTPSKSAKSTGYRTYQRNLPIYDGRYNVSCPISTIAPPVQLFHPVFGHFLDDIADEKLDIPQETLRAAACFMGAASGIYEKEDHRKQAIFPHLAAALSTGMTQIVNSDLTSPDGAVSFPLVGDIYETVSSLLAEDKREVGEGGSDPSIQAGLSMARFWAQNNVCVLVISTHPPLTKLFTHSIASSAITPAAPHSSSPAVARGLLCWGLFSQTKLSFSASPISSGLEWILL